MRGLLTDPERALTAAAGDSDPQPGRTATVLCDALAPKPPTGSMPACAYPPDEPDPSAWRRAGQIRALALGTVPDEQVPEHFTDRFHSPPLAVS